LKHASARIATAVFSALVLALALGTLPVYADANPDNEGHHYGQLKHPKHPPVPVPTPAPVPTPPPSTDPIQTIVPSIKPVTAPGVPGAAHNGIESALQVPVVGSPIKGQSRAAASLPARQDPLWWLVLVILPTLLAIWLIALKRLTGRPAPAPREQEARLQTAGTELVASPQV
jgi:hypothetical protein